jgi:hypothetical protein
MEIEGKFEGRKGWLTRQATIADLFTFFFFDFLLLNIILFSYVKKSTLPCLMIVIES